MLQAILTLNYIAAFVVAIVGFMLGWLWYSPVLFAKPWMAEMKITPEAIKAAKYNMARLFATGLLCTFVSTIGLGVIINACHTANPLKGAAVGLFIGMTIVGARFKNGSLWEGKSAKLQAITIGHEIALFTVQGAILALWH